MWEVVSAVWVWRQSEKPWSSSNMQATLQPRGQQTTAVEAEVCTRLNNCQPFRAMTGCQWLPHHQRTTPHSPRGVHHLHVTAAPGAWQQSSTQQWGSQHRSQHNSQNGSHQGLQSTLSLQACNQRLPPPLPRCPSRERRDAKVNGALGAVHTRAQVLALAADACQWCVRTCVFHSHCSVYQNLVELVMQTDPTQTAARRLGLPNALSK